MKSLSLRERRLIALALLVAAIALGWLAILQPIITGFAERAEQREKLLSRYSANERLIARIPALRRMAEEQAAQASRITLATGDPDQGGELLRRRLEDSLARAGGELRASEVVEPEPGWVRASISAVISHEQMIDWLTHLRSDPPYLAIDQLTVSADRAMNSNKLDLLDVNIEATTPLAAPNKR